MKKTIALTLMLALVLSLTACGKGGDNGADKKSDGVMTYAEYDAAAVDSAVVIETYVQAKQSWWDNKATLYTQDKDGAYAEMFRIQSQYYKEEGNDLYFNVSLNGETYTFTVESYLCGADTDVYKAVKNLNVGDTVDMEGYLYWYEGVNPHITSVTVK